MTSPDRDERYRAGLCITCGAVPHSAGRPRCEACHQQLIDDRREGRTGDAAHSHAQAGVFSITVNREG